MISRRHLGCLILLGSLLFVSAGPVVSAAGLSRQLVGDAQVTTLGSDEPIPATAKRMLPLTGPAFVAPVVEAGFAEQFSTREGTFTAPAGDELVFVGVSLTAFAPPFQQSELDGFAPVLTLTFGSHAVTLAQEPSGTIDGAAGSAYGDPGTTFPGRWLVAVPKGSAVKLTASENGFSQSLDLRRGVRVGSAPTVLYRDQAGPLGLDVRPNLAGSLEVTVAGAAVSIPVTVKEAVLSAFRLDLPVMSSDLPSGQAYLLVHASIGAGTDPAGDQVLADLANPTTAVTVGVPGDPAIAATFGPSPPDPGQTLDGVFGFVVPAAITTASLAVDAGASATVSVTAKGQTSTLTPAVVTAQATFPLSFAPPSSSPPATAGSSPVVSLPASQPGNAPVVPASTVAPTATSSSQAAPGFERRSRSTDTVALVRAGGAAGGGAVIVVLGGFFVWRRRNRTVEPEPVVDSRAVTARTDQIPEHVEVVEGQSVVASYPPQAGDEPMRTVEDIDARPLVDDDGPDRPDVVVRLLGPLEVEGTTGAVSRRTVTRALVVLAVNHPRALGAVELRDLLATDEYSAISAQTLRSELSRLRAVLPAGVLPAGVLPDRASNSGYSLAGRIEVDWHQLQALALEGRTRDRPERVQIGLRALGLVRGPVLGHDSWHGIERSVWEIDAAVEALAADTASTALDGGDPADAAEATRRGLLGVPGSMTLWRLRVAAAKAGSGESVATVTERASRETGLSPFE